MTDEVVLGEVDSTPVDAPVVDDAAAEKMIPSSRVEELIKKAKLKGRDNLQAELDAMKAENEQLKLKQASMGGMAVPLDAEQIKQQIMSDLKKQFQDASEARASNDLQKEAERIAGEYHQKMKAGKDSYEDFDDVMADFRPEAFPNLVYLANQVDNTPAVMYELMQNPAKWATLTVLSERDPQAAQNMLGRISASIKANQQAKAQEKEVAPPLGRLSSSPTGQDTGNLGMKDFKRMFRG
jgi:hypothetical protein